MEERGLGVEIDSEVDDLGAAYDGVRDRGHPMPEPLWDRPQARPAIGSPNTTATC